MTVRPITIRDGTAEDAAGVARVHVTGWRTRYVGLVPQQLLDDLRPEHRVRRWSEWLGGGERRSLFVAVTGAGEADGGERVVGFSAGWPEPEGPADTVEVAAIYLDADYQGHGLGRRLLARVARRGQDDGFTALSLEMLVGNPTAGFYDRMGGRVVGRYTNTIGGQDIAEVRYRWDDIDDLARLDIDAPGD